jgi:hypothetical protein
MVKSHKRTSISIMREVFETPKKPFEKKQGEIGRFRSTFRNLSKTEMKKENRKIEIRSPRSSCYNARPGIAGSDPSIGTKPKAMPSSDVIAQSRRLSNLQYLHIRDAPVSLVHVVVGVIA